MEQGIPLVQNYAPKEYGAESQNWAVVQDLRGLIYVGNNLGVLEYDGSRWRLIQTPRRTTVRSLALDAEGRVCVGAVGEIGYLAPDATGQMAFVDLTPSLDPSNREFSDVWMAAPTSQGFLFQCREYLFLWNQGRFQAIKASSTFHLAFAPGGRILVRERGVGLMELIQGRLMPLRGGERFARESLFLVVELEAARGTEFPGRLLLGSPSTGLWTHDGNSLQPFPSEAAEYLKSNPVYQGVRLADGSFALATLRGGVVLLDAKGRLLGILNREAGLLGDNVKQVSQDRQGRLWLALDNGVAKVEYPSPFSRFDERLGLKGNVWAIHRHQGRLYAATGNGVFALYPEPGTRTGRLRFRLLEGVSTGVFSLLSVEEDLLVAASQGVFAVRGLHCRPLRPSSNVAISFLRSSRNPDRVFVGVQGGLVSLTRSHGAWKDEGLIPGVLDDVYSMAEEDGGDLWLGTLAQGVIRVKFSESWRGGIRGGAPVVERFDARQGLPPDTQTYVHRVEGKILFGTRDGFLRYDKGLQRFIPEESLAGLFPEGPRWIRTFTAGLAGRIWLDSKNEARRIHETGQALPRPGETHRWDPALLRRFSETSVETIYAESDGTVWFGGPEGILKYDPRCERSVDQAFPAQVRRVIPKSGGLKTRATSLNVAFPYRDNALRFEFALPAFDQESANRFRVLLEGYEKDWSPWSIESLKEYTNLPAGQYRFRVQGRNAYGQVGPEGLFAFRILPPWYRTWWAYGTYLLLGSAAILYGIGLRTRLLEERNAELQKRVDQATLDLRERERMLAAQAGELAAANADLQTLNLQLRDANEEKNQFLGVVVHDLRNPLNSILLAAGMIEDSDSLPDTKAKSRLIARSGTEMNSLIGRFLDIAALDAGRLRPEPEPLSLYDLVLEMVERHEPSAHRKEIALQTQLPPTAMPLLADPKFLRAVLDNLLSNAIKFSPTGTTVTVSASQSAHHTEFAVQDAGPGLTREDQRKLFGRFAKLSARPTGGEKSVGLGLSIVKKMLDAMGAQILVESELGKGSRFRVILPSGSDPEARET